MYEGPYSISNTLRPLAREATLAFRWTIPSANKLPCSVETWWKQLTSASLQPTFHPPRKLSGTRGIVRDNWDNATSNSAMIVLTSVMLSWDPLEVHRPALFLPQRPAMHSRTAVSLVSLHLVLVLRWASLFDSQYYAGSITVCHSLSGKTRARSGMR